MLAFRLLRHSVLILVHNFSAAFRISIPYLVVLFASQLVMLEYRTTLSSDFATLPMWMAWAMVALPLAALLVYLATGVAWHRHVLLNEAPRLMMQGRPRQVLSYVGTGFLVALLVMVTMMILIAVSSAMFGYHPMGYATGIVSLVVLTLFYLVITALVLRLATALPGAALRHPRPIRTAWKGTGGHMGSFLLFGLFSMVLQAVVGLSASAVIAVTGSTVAATMVWGVMSWGSTMLALSVLTTLWGYFIEKRDLR
ncbi:hypothetical protein [Paracoccus sp. JM45]|uniref:hypothetical protein n=1 Tax=Paracoccus sp. JM45 TaxID=2283626 RepID=UPI000E6D1E47|nr:hypothetical protein [Paracoccus sp. JM45]RJE80496.1 hypothetical protein DWB67_06390 [Paracoccus sp. JM45]